MGNRVFYFKVRKVQRFHFFFGKPFLFFRAGVLYMLSSPTHRVPMRVLPLINGACQGAKRVYNCPRPHTFQLTIGNTVLHLAAPDEYVASEWLQALVQAASGVSRFYTSVSQV